MMDSSDFSDFESAPLINEQTHSFSVSKTTDNVCKFTLPSSKVYKRRWWTIFVFFLCCTSQTLCQTTWMPISDAVLIVYNWDVNYIALARASCSLAFMLFAIPVMYVVVTKGM